MGDADEKILDLLEVDVGHFEGIGGSLEGWNWIDIEIAIEVIKAGSTE